MSVLINAILNGRNACSYSVSLCTPKTEPHNDLRVHLKGIWKRLTVITTSISRKWRWKTMLWFFSPEYGHKQVPLCHNLMLQFLLLLIPGRFLFCNALKLSLFFSLNEYLECGLNEKIFKLTENSISMGCLQEIYF